MTSRIQRPVRVAIQLLGSSPVAIPYMALDPKRLAFLNQKARQIRRDCLIMVHAANSGHLGGSLSAADLLTALYYAVMQVRPEEPSWPQRDRFILSKGHCTPVYYAVLADRGYFPREDLLTFRMPGSYLQGHPSAGRTPGVDASTGTLGLGLSTACGMALAGRMALGRQTYFVLCGDGEQQEGQIWEAAMFASKFHLDNLIAITDRNRLQTDGGTEQVMPLEPLCEKWRSFGWQSWEVDGHNFDAIIDAIMTARSLPGRPTMIIANTIKGRGVSFMENVVSWHGTPPTDDEVQEALRELS